MCCLFGFHDYGYKLTRRQRSELLSVLSIASEERGIDATGIAYNHQGKQHIYKRPLPARRMWFRVPEEATVVMGHTRMTTQGSARRNQNNHPFRGNLKGHSFAMAHNGVLHNDKHLRKKNKLPKTNIETDSYVATQLIEQSGKLDFPSLQHMAEQLEGSFTITVLSDNDDLYFIRGNNPLCIYHFPEKGIYVYASTEQILLNALAELSFSLGNTEAIKLNCGDILCIHKDGHTSKSNFDDTKIGDYYSHIWPWSGRRSFGFISERIRESSSYLEDLKAVASGFGLYPEDIDALLMDGITPEEIEEYLYCG